MTSPQEILEGDGDDMTPFFNALRSSNPFHDNRVNGLSADGVDVDDIHRAQFEQLTELARQAFQLRRGLGAVVWGEAGIGKSHLLARLTAWAETDSNACAVYLHNLQASPQNLPRSLLKSVVSMLTRGRVSGFPGTPLYKLVHGLVAEALHHDTTIKHPWPKVERDYSRLIDRLSQEDSSRAAVVDRTIYDVLYRFFRSAHRAHKTRDDREAQLAVRWLSGDCLDPADARLIGVPHGRGADEPAALEDNQQIKQVLTALSRMALSLKQPFLLCFDQVDNLDDDQAAALSRFLEALIDGAPNLLIVVAGIQSSLFRWRQLRVFQDSAWDRLTQFEIQLLPLAPLECRRIIAARLDKVVAPFTELDLVRQRREQDPLFPLGQAWAEKLFEQKIDWRPRDLINRAREGWRREQDSLRQVGGQAWLRDWPQLTHTNGKPPEKDLTEEQIRQAIDAKVDQKIAEYCERLRLQPGSLSLDADTLARVVADLFKQIGGFEIEESPSGKPNASFPYSRIVRQRPDGENHEVRTGLLFLVSDSAISTTAALGRLVNAGDSVDRVFLVTHEQRELAFGVSAEAKGRAYYEELRGRGRDRFQHINLTAEQYTQLHALQAVTSARDLEIDLPGAKTRAVTGADVVASNRRRGRYLALPVLRDLCTEAGSNGNDVPGWRVAGVLPAG